MSNRRSFPSCGHAILSLWTICPRIRSMASDRRSRPPAQTCATCRPTARLQSHRNGLRQAEAALRAAEARAIPDLWQAIADPKAASSHKNAPTISPAQDTTQYHWKFSRSLKEKTRRSLQLLGGFKQELTAHTLFALLISQHIRCVDAKSCR
jgi:hypothetical protein